MNTNGSLSVLAGFYQSCSFNSGGSIFIFLVSWMITVPSLLPGAGVYAKPSNNYTAISGQPDHAISINPCIGISNDPNSIISSPSGHAISFNPGTGASPGRVNNPGTGSIGLTLSGGGAKGFAHIGVLHVIDSLGLKVDYISGTSFGAVVGAMYATGYTAKEIEEIAKSIDWRSVFGMKPDLDYVHIHNRRESGRYMLEFPLKRTGIQFRSGFIQGQQLWSILEKLFFHVRTIDDFNDFLIPFACVATNIETGEEVVISNGDIVSALRASMAMPAVFEPVTRDDKVLFDGGMVNNFPVDVVKEMGADYVIGVYVSDGLRSAENLRTPVEVVYQMGFIKDALKFRINKEQADIYLEPSLEKFTPAGFTHIGEIIEAGKQSARRFSAHIDSIAKAGQNTRSGSARETDRKRNIMVDTVLFKGLENVRLSYINNISGIQPEDIVNADKVQNLVNIFYATDHFDMVTYSYVPSPSEPEKVNLIFNFTEKPLARISGAIHYNSFAGVGIIGGISLNSFIFHNMDAGLSMRIGEQPAARTGVRIFTGNTHKTWFKINGHGEMIDLPLYRNFSSTGDYRQRYLRAESSVNRTTGKNSFFTTGAAIYTNRIEPQILTGFDFNGSEQGFEAFTRWNMYSLDHHSLPLSGQNLTAELLYYFGRDYSINVISETGNTTDVPHLNIDGENFFRIKFIWESFIPLNPGLTYFTRLQGGYNYPSSQGIFNLFNMGGDQPFLRNQVAFSGLDEFRIMSSSVVVGAIGFNYNVMSDFYLSPVLNTGLYDFRLNRLDELSTNQLVLGAGLGIGYLSFIGPIQVSFSYSPHAGSLVTFVNVGWSF